MYLGYNLLKSKIHTITSVLHFSMDIVYLMEESMTRRRRRTQLPGETPSGNGKFQETGPRGGKVNKPRTITITPGDGHMPPTQKPGNKWRPK